MRRAEVESDLWSLGSLVVMGAAWLWLSQTPQIAVMRDSSWAFPLALVNHLVGLVLLIGMRLPLDLRLIGWSFEGVPVSQLATRTAPFAAVGAVVPAAVRASGYVSIITWVAILVAGRLIAFVSSH